MHFLLNFFVLLIFTELTFAQPIVNNLGSLDQGQIRLDAAAKKALKKSFPRFRLFRHTDFITTVRELFSRIQKQTPHQLPNAILADFTGDTVKDLLVWGTNGVNDLAILLIRTKKGYRPIVVYKQKFKKPAKQRKVSAGMAKNPEYGLNTYLSKNDKKNIPILDPSRFAPRDFMQIETYLGSTLSFYYSRGKVHRYVGQPL